MEGGVCIMEFSRATVCLFPPTVGSSNMVSFQELLDGKYDGVKTTYYPKVRKRGKVYFAKLTRAFMVGIVS